MSVYLGNEKISVYGGITNKSPIPIPPGYSKIAIDYLEKGLGIVDGTTINHSLGVIPNRIVIFNLKDGEYYFTDIISIKLNNGGGFRTGTISFLDWTTGERYNGNISATATENTITLSETENGFEFGNDTSFAVITIKE